MRRRQPVYLDPLQVMNRKQLAKWLAVSERTIDRLRPPALPLGEGTRRYLLRDVLAWLEARRTAA
jgi:hypothetical protein